MTGTQALYNKRLVTILLVTDKEVLILYNKGTEWVSKELFNLVSNIKI